MEDGIVLHIDVSAKTLTTPEGVIYKGRIHYSGYLELQIKDTHLKMGMDSEFQDILEGEWPEDLWAEVSQVKVNLSRHGTNPHCNTPVTHLAVHTSHACEFNDESSMEVYSERVEGDLAVAETKIIKLIEEYYEAQSGEHIVIKTSKLKNDEEPE